MTPTASNIERELAALLADTAKIDADTISPDSKLAALGVDSLSIVEVIFEIEDRYGISIDYNANDGAIETFSTLVDLVAALVNAKAVAQAAPPLTPQTADTGA